MAMDYKDVLAFLAVARLESYSRAAEELHLAQSALSRRVMRLEHALGVSLLERHPRGVRATKAGEILARRASQIDIELRKIEQDIRSLSSSVEEDVYIAMPQGAARLLAAPIVARFQAAYPKARLHIFEGESVVNQESALRGDVAFALVYSAQSHEALVLRPLLVERILVIGPAADREARGYPDSYGLKELARLPLILPGPVTRHGYRTIVEQATRQAGLAPNIVLEVNGFATSLTMVQQGLGYTISTYPPVQSGIEGGNFVGIPIDWPKAEVELSLVYRTNTPMPTMLRALKTIIEEVSASIKSSPYSRPAVDLETESVISD
ncbi:MAG TPA: LysR family transcriptional regulator [Stellaceae bacterium]|jgi:LysR family nitrogen assimilation transcriptional regulator|nr:LysR family transcriptional regulator [Stellaceae bacterium]